jgi:hypothetical protein
MRDIRGRPLVAQRHQRHLQADQKPEGKAATRRRKQMERQLQKAVGPIELVEKAGCDACGLDAVDRCPHCQMATCGKCAVCEHWAGKPGVVVVESNPTNGPGLAQRLFVNRQMNHETLAALMTTKPGQVIPIDNPAKFVTQYLADIDHVAGGYYNDSGDAFKRNLEAGTITVGVDPGRPEGDVTTVSLRKGNTITILDEAAQVPQHVWDEMGADVSRRINERIAAELGGGKPPPVNRARRGFGMGRGLLAATVLAMMVGIDKPKE